MKVQHADKENCATTKYGIIEFRTNSTNLTLILDIFHSPAGVKLQRRTLWNCLYQGLWFVPTFLS